MCVYSHKSSRYANHVWCGSYVNLRMNRNTGFLARYDDNLLDYFASKILVPALLNVLPNVNFKL